MNLCGCGCGLEVAKKFARGHSTRLYSQSEEWRKKQSISHLGKKRPKGELNSNYGRKHSEASKKKIAENQKGKKHSEETKNKISKALTGRVISKEIVEKGRQGRIEYYSDPKNREKQSIAGKKAWQEGKFDHIEKLRYSKQEQRLAPIMEKLGYSWSGKSPYFIRGLDRTRVPDFYNHKTKEVVEVFGTWYHRDMKLPNGRTHETTEQYIDWYKNLGYTCIVYWED